MSNKVCPFCKSKFERIVPIQTNIRPEQFPDDGHIYRAPSTCAFAFRCGTMMRIEEGGIAKRTRDCMELSEMSMRREIIELKEELQDAWRECEMFRSALQNTGSNAVFELVDEIIKFKKQVRKLTRTHVPMPRSQAANAGACEAWEKLTKAELNVQRLIQAGDDVAQLSRGSEYVEVWRKVVEEVKS